MEQNKSLVKSTQNQDLEVSTNVKELISIFQSNNQLALNNIKQLTSVTQQTKNDESLVANSINVEEMESKVDQMIALVEKLQAENEGIIKQLQAENLELKSEKALYGEKFKRSSFYESLINNLQVSVSENAVTIKRLQAKCNDKDLQLDEKERLIASLEAKYEEKNNQLAKALDKLKDIEKNMRDEDCCLVETLEKHAKVCYNQGKYLEALLHCESAIALENSAQNRLSVFARLLSNKAGCYLCLEQPQQAIESASLSIHYDASCKEAFQNRAGAYFELEQYTNALQDLKAALQLDPTCEKIFNLLTIVQERIDAKK